MAVADRAADILAGARAERTVVLGKNISVWLEITLALPKT